MKCHNSHAFEKEMSDDLHILETGSKFGQHHVVRLIGRGGMGEVYEVTDEAGSAWAMKVLSRDMMDNPGAVERFRREARVMSEMDHEGIVNVDSTGCFNGRHWLRMELATGCHVRGRQAVTLEDYFDANECQLAEEEVKDLVNSMLNALEYAHGLGLVHRDLKPANVLFFGNQPKIADFGLVDAAGTEWMETQVRNSMVVSVIEETLLDTDSGSDGSRSKALMGTFAYMSPEQKDGKKADARSDLYAIGLMAREAITGVRTLGMERPTEIAKGIHPGWDEWMRRAVANDVAHRFKSAVEMRSGLSFSKTKRKRKPLRLAVFGLAVVGAVLCFLYINFFVDHGEIESSPSSAPGKGKTEKELAGLDSGKSGLRVMVDPPEVMAEIRFRGQVLPLVDGKAFLSDVVPGIGEIIVKAEGYEDYKNKLDLEEGWNKERVGLVPLRGRLTIYSDPEVKVVAKEKGVDGKKFVLGVTNPSGFLDVRGILAVGGYVVELSKRDRIKEIRDVILQEDVVEIRQSLAPLPGKLSVTASQADVTIKIKGIYEGKAPLEDVEVPAEYKLEVIALHEGFRIEKRTIYLEANGSKFIEFPTLTKESGSIRLNMPSEMTSGSAIRVFLNGKDLGEAGVSSKEFQSLVPGSHEVRVTHPDFVPWIREIQVVDQEIKEVKFDGVPLPGVLIVSPSQPGTKVNVSWGSGSTTETIGKKSARIEVPSRLKFRVDWSLKNHRSQTMEIQPLKPKQEVPLALGPLELLQGSIILETFSGFKDSAWSIEIGGKKINSVKRNLELGDGKAIFEISQIPLGPNTIRISHPDFEEHSSSVDIIDETPVRVVHQTKRHEGRLWVKVVQPEAKIYLNGSKETSYMPNTYMQLYANVPYELTVKLEGYYPKTEKVKLKPGEQKSLDFGKLVNITELLLANERKTNGDQKILLSGKGITKLDAFAGLSKTIELNLSNNDISNLEPLSKLINLKVLRLSGNRIVNIEPLKNLHSLERLDLSENEIVDVRSLSDLYSLQYLSLGSNRVELVSPLKKLKTLKYLDLGKQFRPIKAEQRHILNFEFNQRKVPTRINW